MIGLCRSLRRVRRPLQRCCRHLSSTTNNKGLSGLLSKEEEVLLEEQGDLTLKAKSLSERIGIKMNPTLFDKLPQLQNGFSIVVAGEFNAGKSSVINALLGHKLLDTGALPTTEAITLLTHIKSTTTTTETVTTHLQGGLLWHQVSSIPEGIVLVDTPGTNAVIVDHTSRTLKLLPTADLILFCTSADRPFPESERQLLQSIQAYRKNIIVIINKMDVLDASGGVHGEKEKDKVVQFVTEHASTMLGGRPLVIPISAKDALSSKLYSSSSSDNNNTLWDRSNFEALELYLKESLTTETKLKAKLLNPVGVAEGVLVEGLQHLQQQEGHLTTDVATLNLLNSQFDSWTKEMDMDMRVFCTEIRNDMETEGRRVKDMVDRIGIISLLQWALLDSAKLDGEWKRSIVRSTEMELTEKIRQISDSISTRAQSQGQAVIDYLGKRPSRKNKDIVGNVVAASQFEDTRKVLQEQMQGALQEIFSHYDKDATKKTIQTSLQQSAALAVCCEASALLSCASVYLEAVDLVSGGTYGLASAALGAVVVSRAGSTISQHYSKEWNRLGSEAHAALQVLSDKELQKVNRRILDGVKPYSRHVQTEQERLQTLVTECEEAISQAQAIRSRINKLRRYD